MYVRFPKLFFLDQRIDVLAKFDFQNRCRGSFSTMQPDTPLGTPD